MEAEDAQMAICHRRWQMADGHAICDGRWSRTGGHRGIMRGVTVLMLSMLMLMQLHRCTAYVAIGPHKSVWPMGSAAGPARTRQVCVPRVPLAYRARRESLVVRPAVVALSGVGETISTPGSIADMMKDAGDGVLAACSSGVKMMAVEVPLPITGGTELDDWPGGIGQKYETLRPMLAETLRSLGFSAEQIASREFMSLEDDAIGIWQRTEEDGSQLSVVVFATPEVLGGLQELAAKGTLILVNHQFFLDQFSRKETKDFIAGCEIIYLLQSLNMKGPGLLPVKGVLRRSYPGEFVVARRVDAGVFEVLKTFATKPPQDQLEALFFKDSEVRDKELSFFDRLKRLGAEATNI